VGQESDHQFRSEIVSTGHVSVWLSCIVMTSNYLVSDCSLDATVGATANVKVPDLDSVFGAPNEEDIFAAIEFAGSGLDLYRGATARVSGNVTGTNVKEMSGLTESNRETLGNFVDDEPDITSWSKGFGEETDAHNDGWDGEEISASKDDENNHHQDMEWIWEEDAFNEGHEDEFKQNDSFREATKPVAEPKPSEDETLQCGHYLSSKAYDSSDKGREDSGFIGEGDEDSQHDDYQELPVISSASQPRQRRPGAHPRMNTSFSKDSSKNFASIGNTFPAPFKLADEEFKQARQKRSCARTSTQRIADRDLRAFNVQQMLVDLQQLTTRALARADDRQLGALDDELRSACRRVRAARGRRIHQW